MSEIIVAVRSLHIGEPAKISRALFLADELLPAITQQQVMHARMNAPTVMRDLSFRGRDKCGHTSLSGGIHPNVYFTAHPVQSAQPRKTTQETYLEAFRSLTLKKRPPNDHQNGAGIGSRTPNLQIRSLALYPVELCPHKRRANKLISSGDFKQNFRRPAAFRSSANHAVLTAKFAGRYNNSN